MSGLPESLRPSGEAMVLLEDRYLDPTKDGGIEPFLGRPRDGTLVRLEDHLRGHLGPDDLHAVDTA